MPAMQADSVEDDELVVLDAVAEEARAALGVADGDQHLAEARGDHRAGRSRKPTASASAEAAKSAPRVCSAPGC